MRYAIDVWLRSPDGTEQLFTQNVGDELHVLQALLQHFRLEDVTIGTSDAVYRVDDDHAFKVARIEIRPERRLTERVVETIEREPRS